MFWALSAAALASWSAAGVWARRRLRGGTGGRPRPAAPNVVRAGAPDVVRRTVAFDRTEYGGERDILLAPCRLANLGDEPAWLWTTTTAARDRPDPWVVEVVAARGLRETYGLVDGSRVEIVLPDAPRGTEPPSSADGVRLPSDLLSTEMNVRLYTPADDAEWRRMRRALWPHHETEPDASGSDDAAAWRARSDAVVLVAARSNSAGLAGFAEAGARDYADGCDTTPVAYLEGWYVDPDVRRTGVGAALVRAAEAWARARGYAEFASDALLENDASQRAHAALGFAEVERSVKYRKAL